MRMDLSVSGASYLFILHKMHEVRGKGEEAKSVCARGQVWYQADIPVMLIIFSWERDSVRQIQAHFK